MPHLKPRHNPSKYPPSMLNKKSVIFTVRSDTTLNHGSKTEKLTRYFLSTWCVVSSERWKVKCHMTKRFNWKPEQRTSNDSIWFAWILRTYRWQRHLRNAVGTASIFVFHARACALRSCHCNANATKWTRSTVWIQIARNSFYSWNSIRTLHTFLRFNCNLKSFPRFTSIWIYVYSKNLSE